MIRNHPGYTFWVWVAIGRAMTYPQDTPLWLALAADAWILYGLFLIGNYWLRARPRRNKARIVASIGLSEPTKEQERFQEQYNEYFRKQTEFLAVQLFTRARRLAKARFPDQEPDGIGAHVKLYCTGEGENERSLAASTPEQRRFARYLADEIMAIDVSGLYAVPSEKFVATVESLPDDPASIRRLALCFDQSALIHMLSLAFDVTKPVDDRVNKAALIENALPLLRHAEHYDGDSAVLQTTIAQTYYTLGDVEAGFAAAKKATELNPNSAEAWRLLGNGYMGQNNDAEAQSCFNRALSIDPTINGAREALALVAAG